MRDEARRPRRTLRRGGRPGHGPVGCRGQGRRPAAASLPGATPGAGGRLSAARTGLRRWRLPYPHDDLGRLEEELRRFVDLGYTHAKIKIGAAGLDQDRRRIDRALRVLGDASRLAVDAMNRYDAGARSTQRKPWRRWGCGGSRTSATPTISLPRPKWRISIRGPSVPARPCSPWPRLACWISMAACGGSATCLCSTPCIAMACRATWRYSTTCAPGVGRARPSARTPATCSACAVAALRLGWAEATPSAFRPFDDFAGALPFSSGLAGLPQSPGIGFERQATLAGLFRKLLEV